MKPCRLNEWEETAIFLVGMILRDFDCKCGFGRLTRNLVPRSGQVVKPGNE